MKKADRGILAKILVLFFLIILAYSLYDHRQSVHDELEFRKVLDNFDRQIVYGRENEAAETLRILLHVDLSSYQYLQVLKRAWPLAVKGSGVSVFEDFARTATERFPGREELWFIYCRALMLKGNPERAGDLARKKLHSDRYLGMRAESLLAAGMEIGTTEKQKAEESNFPSGSLIRLPGSRDPREFSSAGRAWNSPELIADAALLYAEEGMVETGNELLKNSPGSQFPELSLQLAYDARDSQYGLVLIQKLMSEQAGDLSGLKLYQADFTLDSGRTDKVLEIYRDIMHTDPAYSVLPYINAGALDPAGEEEYLVQGLDYFPRTVILLERLGEHYYKNGDAAAARRIFDQLLEVDPGHPAAGIRLADMKMGAGSQGSIARLWESYHGENGDALGLYLGWRLFGNRDQDGLRILLDLQRQRKGPDQDLLEGLLLTIRGDVEAAAGKFDEAYEASPRWEYLFNAGRLYLEAGKADAALRIFSRADEIFTLRDDLPAAGRSRVWLGIGEAYSVMDDRKNSANALQYALDLDPSNLRASLLLNTLGEIDQHTRF